MSKVIITGANSLLGNSVLKLFKQDRNWTTFGISDNETFNTPELPYYDLSNEDSVKLIFTQFSEPDVLIHCSELGPSECQQDFELAMKRNVKTVEILARICSEKNCWILYIGSSSVFDGHEGKNSPYSPNFELNPISNYGKTKKEAETILWKFQSDAGVLRVPHLYGILDDLNKNEITQITLSVLEEKKLVLDDEEIIYPTYVEDISDICKALSCRKIQHCGLYGTWHWSGPEGFTRYKLAIQLATHFKKSCNITPKTSNSRIIDSKLNCIALEMMGLANKKTKFLTGITSVLQEKGLIN